VRYWRWLSVKVNRKKNAIGRFDHSVGFGGGGQTDRDTTARHHNTQCSGRRDTVCLFGPWSFEPLPSSKLDQILVRLCLISEAFVEAFKAIKSNLNLSELEWKRGDKDVDACPSRRPHPGPTGWALCHASPRDQQRDLLLSCVPTTSARVRPPHRKRDHIQGSRLLRPPVRLLLHPENAGRCGRGTFCNHFAASQSRNKRLEGKITGG